ncbi:MAG TPA: DUF192 domain-containing protein [Methylibium sp.]|uniref:DUF192 domain-containing protein n=1 Tax=Methylibium sp. TaxID=2067992 RepID=UPI002DB9E42C|nr:DUF192 domain-containing protein [Methylibium sp.]HEU4458259.1 DUF192 domain-containing protein [Methylibium sp.]
MNHAQPMRTVLPALRVRHALRWHERLRGLLARAPLGPDEALEIAPCNSVHTAGMRYAIDVVFVDRRGGIVRVVEGLKPWRAAACWRASRVVELHAGCAARHGLAPGERWPPPAR